MKNNMKKKLLSTIILLAAAMGISASAEDLTVKMYVNPTEISADEKGIARVEVWLDTNCKELNSFQMQIRLPEGFSIQKNSRGKYVITPSTDEDVIYSHQFQTSDHDTDTNDPYINLTATSLNLDFLGTGNNMLFWFNVVAPEDFTPEKYPEGVSCNISNIGVAQNLGGTNVVPHYSPTSYFTILPYSEGSDVDDVMVDEDGDGDEEIYDLRGVRVHRPLAPGYYIINGTKTAVH